MGREDMRAADADRQRVADQLKTALDEGRLDLGEYDERIQRAYGARTYGELDGLLTDLPGTIPAQRSQVQPAAPQHLSEPEQSGQSGQPPRKGGVGPMLSIFVICTLVWAISSVASGEFHYFWPLWVLIPVAFAVLARLRDRDKRRH